MKKKTNKNEIQCSLLQRKKRTYLVTLCCIGVRRTRPGSQRFLLTTPSPALRQTWTQPCWAKSNHDDQQHPNTHSARLLPLGTSVKLCTEQSSQGFEGLSLSLSSYPLFFTHAHWFISCSCGVQVVLGGAAPHSWDWGGQEEEHPPWRFHRSCDGTVTAQLCQAGRGIIALALPPCFYKLTWSHSPCRF